MPVVEHTHEVKLHQEDPSLKTRTILFKKSHSIPDKVIEANIKKIDIMVCRREIQMNLNEDVSFSLAEELYKFKTCEDRLNQDGKTHTDEDIKDIRQYFQKYGWSFYKQK